MSRGGPNYAVPRRPSPLMLGVPAPLASQAAFASFLSVIKDERIDASAVLNSPKAALTGERQAMIERLRKALHAAFILAYVEGYFLLSASGESREDASTALSDTASAVASMAAAARSRCGPKESVILDATIKSSLDPTLVSLRRICTRCVEGGLHAPGLSAALIYYDGYRSTWLPSNMVVALRDSRECSGYERVDRPRGEIFHSEWK